MKRIDRRVISTMSALILSLAASSAALATQIQPFLCAGSDGSNVTWTNVQGQSAIGATLRQSGDQGGGKYVQLSNVKGNSTVNVSTITNTTSSNLIIRLQARTTTNQSITMSPTSSSGNNYGFNLQSGGLNSSQTLSEIAVYAQNVTGSPGTIFFTNFVLNGGSVTSHVNNNAGCLGGAAGSPPPPGGSTPPSHSTPGIHLPTHRVGHGHTSVHAHR